MTSRIDPANGRLQAISPDREDLRKAADKAAKTAGAVAKFFGYFMISLIALALFLGEALANRGGIGLLVVLGGAWWLFEGMSTETPPNTATSSRRRQYSPSSRQPRAQIALYRRSGQLDGEEVGGTPATWIQRAAWPKEPARVRALTISTPSRNASLNQTSCAYKSALLGRRIECESQLERLFFQRLEGSGLATSFVEQPVRIPYIWQTRQTAYYPDAAVLLRDGRQLLVEVKPVNRFTSARDQAKWKAALAWSRRNGFGFVVVDPRRGYLLGEKFFSKQQGTSNGNGVVCL